MMDPRDFMETKGIDANQIVSYYCRDGMGEGVDIDMEDLMNAYANYKLEEARKEISKLMKVSINLITDWEQPKTIIPSINEINVKMVVLEDIEEILTRAKNQTQK